MSAIGELNVPINKKTYTFQGALTLKNTGIQFSCTEENSLPLTYNKQALILDHAGIIMGFEVGVVTGGCLGITGEVSTLRKKTNKKDKYQSAIILDVGDLGISPDLIYIYINEINFADLGYFLFPTKKKPSRSAVTLKNVMLYECDTEEVLPDGTIMTPGSGFNCEAVIHGFDFGGGLQLIESSGFKGDLFTDPINIDSALSITGTTKKNIATGKNVKQPYVSLNTASLENTFELHCKVTLLGLGDAYDIHIGIDGITFSNSISFMKNTLTLKTTCDSNHGLSSGFSYSGLNFHSASNLIQDKKNGALSVSIDFKKVSITISITLYVTFDPIKPKRVYTENYSFKKIGHDINKLESDFEKYVIKELQKII